jgi:hypothetical protein
MKESFDLFKNLKTSFEDQDVVQAFKSPEILSM